MSYVPSDRQDKVCVLCMRLCAYACQLYWSSPLSTYLIFHREDNKGKHIQRTTNYYIPHAPLT